jgi:hypothetical protein
VYIFSDKDLTNGHTSSTNGTSTLVSGARFRELNLQHSTDSYQIKATTTSDVAVLTGSGNDSIDLSHATGMNFIDAGAGTNTLALGAGKTNVTLTASSSTTPNSQPFTNDNIANFHTGDSFTFSGVTSLTETIRGSNTNYTAWNPAVPGSAVYASFSNLAAPLTVTQAGNSITLHA